MGRVQTEPVSLVSKGELLAWKGYWWKVEDVAAFEDGCEVLLRQKSETFSLLKKQHKHRSWKKDHPNVGKHQVPVSIDARQQGEKKLDAHAGNPDNPAPHVEAAG
jgi:hypothetical protein